MNWAVMFWAGFTRNWTTSGNDSEQVYVLRACTIGPMRCMIASVHAGASPELGIRTCSTSAQDVHAHMRACGSAVQVLSERLDDMAQGMDIATILNGLAEAASA